jgi:hypothetical protein
MSRTGALSAPEELPRGAVRDCIKIGRDWRTLHRAFLTT